MTALNLIGGGLGVTSFQTDEGFITALCEQIEPVLRQAQKFGNPRLLFSAHGLPEKIVRGGDPYPAQCRETVEAVVKKLARPDLDFILCYQSKVGPMKWIGPSTEDEIIKAAKAKRPIVIVPVAFVSEHSETLVELGMDDRDIALDHGVPFYGVAETVGTNKAFIDGLAAKINQTVAKNEKTDIFSGTKL